MNANHFLGTLGAVLVVLLLAGGLYGCPQYQVYQQRLTGEAELARADSETAATAEHAGHTYARDRQNRCVL
jgi:hypothetical protein